MDLSTTPKEAILGSVKFNLLVSYKFLAGKDIDFASKQLILFIE